MRTRPRRAGRPLRPLTLTLAAVMGLAGLLTACAGDPPPSPPAWVAATATPLTTTDPADPLDDLAPLREAVGDAEIVGLGESVHGAAEELTLKHRALRVLVEQLGFRSVAWEEDWTTGRRINDYITTGTGDLDTLVSRMSPQWQSREVADTLRWLRGFNSGRPDKVQFVGIEYYLTGRDAYDAVESSVAAAAPERLTELGEHLTAIRPTMENVFEHIRTYMAVADKEPHLRHARAVYELVLGLPHAPGEQDHALAVHTARQILSFHEHFALPMPDSHAYRDAHSAENLMWWHELTGDKIAYWAASPHTANAADLRIVSPDGELRFPSAGSHLRERYGEGYLSIGFTFDHGSVSDGGGATIALPEPTDGWFEQPLGQVEFDQFIIDLRAPAPTAVRDWLDRPITTRGPSGPGSHAQGGSASQWFDLIVHSQGVTPAGMP